jgi:hypothetical protein
VSSSLPPVLSDSISAEAYGPKYRDHLLEQYTLYVEMADRISARRQETNTFFLSINTALIAFLGIVVRGEPDEVPLAWVTVVSLAGAALCFAWYRLVTSYRGLNTGKFAVIHAIEVRLPLSPYAAEWEAVGEGKDPKRYRPFTHVEASVPWIFAALYAGFAAWQLVA